MVSQKRRPVDPAGLGVLLRSLRLPSFGAYWEEAAGNAEQKGWSFAEFLQALVEQEVHDRAERKVERLRKRSGLASDKTLDTLDPKLLPAKIRRQLPSLCAGGFADRAENILVFGLPGRGKSHLVSAIGHQLVERDVPVLFIKTVMLVQRLLIAKRDLELEKMLRKLDRYSVVILDDIGYVQQDREEMEVLFTFLAERYERRSVMITSNLVFSEWDRIFKDPMTTAAAIDRLVHHSVILDMTGPSVRGQQAKERNRKRNGGGGKQ